MNFNIKTDNCSEISPNPRKKEQARFSLTIM